MFGMHCTMKIMLMQLVSFLYKEPILAYVVMYLYIILRIDVIGSNSKLLKWQDKNGNTLLHLATFCDFDKAVSLLIKLGSQVDMKNKVSK